MKILNFFLRKNKKPNIEDSKNLSSETEIKTKNIIEEDTYSKDFIFNDKEIKITEFKKAINDTFKTKGLLESNKMFEYFWSKNEERLHLNDAQRLINNHINLLKKEKITSDSISEFIEKKLSKFLDAKNYEFVAVKAKMIEKFDLNKSLEYLKIRNNLEEKEKTNLEAFIATIYLEAEYLLKNKDYNSAFVNIRRASNVIHNLNQFNYLKWSENISDLSGQICYQEKIPKYDSYLIHEMNSFLYRILIELSSFPLMANFNGWKKEYKNSDWPFGNDRKIDKALTKLNMQNSKSDLLLELKEFAYNKLPVIYGIPEDYDSNENLIDENYTKWERYKEIKVKLQSKFCDKETVMIDDFTSKLIKKYYFINNPKEN